MKAVDINTIEDIIVVSGGDEIFKIVIKSICNLKEPVEINGFRYESNKICLTAVEFGSGGWYTSHPHWVTIETYLLELSKFRRENNLSNLLDDK